MKPPTARATDREREDTVEVLRAAFAAGCLDGDELVQRAVRAYAAVTIDDRYSLVRDLPGEPEPGPRARPGGRDARRTLGAAVPFVLLWLVALQALGLQPRLTAHRAPGSRKHPC
jgi:hypothetical protein